MAGLSPARIVPCPAHRHKAGQKMSPAFFIVALLKHLIKVFLCTRMNNPSLLLPNANPRNLNFLAIGLRLVWQSYPRIEPNVISIRQARDLLVVFTHIRLPSDSASRRTLDLHAHPPSANSSYCQVCSGLSPPSNLACPSYHKRRRKLYAPACCYCAVEIVGFQPMTQGCF